MIDNFEKNFNISFWKIFGVNNRVYNVKDIFNIKRDKQADEKAYNNFILNDKLLSNTKLLELNSKEENDFYVLFRSYLIGPNKNTDFYVNQLNNITYNFKLFQKINFIDYNYIDLFAFQIASILEHMNSNQYDIHLFEEAIKRKSIIPFLDDCKKINNIKTNKDLSIEMSYTLDSLIEHWLKKIETDLQKITPSSFEKKISNWKTEKELPSLINLLTIINVMVKNNKEESDYRYALLFQLLITRAVLHIEREYNISEDITNKFLNRLQFFRDEIASTYESKNQKEYFETLQGKYLLDFSSIIESGMSIHNVFGIMSDKLIPFMRNHLMHNQYPNDKEIIKMPNKDKITTLFNDKKYNEIFTLLIDSSKNDLDARTINMANSYMKLLIAIKLEDKPSIKQYYKYFDRSSLGCLLSISDTEFNSQELINMFKSLETLEECMGQMKTYLTEKLSTLE